MLHLETLHDVLTVYVFKTGTSFVQRAKNIPGYHPKEMSYICENFGGRFVFTVPSSELIYDY